MIHYIYCYHNKINNKEYVGQTNNLNNRKKQHIQDSIHQHIGHENAYLQPIHCAIRKYGINNFDINILEIIDTDNWDQVNKKESQWIKARNSLVPNGYNLKAIGVANKGKNKSKLDSQTISNIITDLKNKVYISDIAEKYQISKSYVSDINNGRCLKQPNENYPLQQNRMTKEQYYEIFDLLQNTNYSINQIAIYLHRNKDTIQKINKGYQKIVQDLYEGTFPIRKNTRFGYTLKPVETISGETESRVIIDT